MLLDDGVTIIENTDKAQREYGFAYGPDFVTLSQASIEALSAGKCLAIDINGNEYVLFLDCERIKGDEWH